MVSVLIMSCFSRHITLTFQVDWYGLPKGGHRGWEWRWIFNRRVLLMRVPRERLRQKTLPSRVCDGVYHSWMSRAHRLFILFFHLQAGQARLGYCGLSLQQSVHSLLKWKPPNSSPTYPSPYYHHNLLLDQKCNSHTYLKRNTIHSSGSSFPTLRGSVPLY